MKRTLQWRKILNTLAIGLALLLLGMIFGGILQYGWDKETMRITVTTDEKKADSKNTTGGAILETGTEKRHENYKNQAYVERIRILRRFVVLRNRLHAHRDGYAGRYRG